VVNGHSFMLIRQMASLVRRALAEVCTVPVLLVVACVVLLPTTPGGTIGPCVCVRVCVPICRYVHHKRTFELNDC